MWIVYSHVEKPARNFGDSSYGDKPGGWGGLLPSVCPQRKEKIFDWLRDKHANHSPYYSY